MTEINFEKFTEQYFYSEISKQNSDFDQPELTK